MNVPRSRFCLSLKYLRHYSHCLPQALMTHVLDILSSKVNVTLLRLIEAKQQPYDSAFPEMGNKERVFSTYWRHGTHVKPQ